MWLLFWPIDLTAIHLQGQYAFVVYDSNRKQAFAARDPSGREALYYSFDNDDGLRCARRRRRVRHQSCAQAKPSNAALWLHVLPCSGGLTPVSTSVCKAQRHLGRERVAFCVRKPIQSAM